MPNDDKALTDLGISELPVWSASLTGSELVPIFDPVTQKFYRVTAAQIGQIGAATTFASLSDTPADYVGGSLLQLRVNNAADGIEFVNPSFVDLTDTPNSYAGDGGVEVRVNDTEDGIKFEEPPLGATKVTFDQDTDDQVHIISNGTGLQSIGLSLVQQIDAPNDQDNQIFISLPSIVGSTGSTRGRIAILANGVVQADTTRDVPNDAASARATFVVVRPLGISGTVTWEVQIEALSGTITVDNTVGANGRLSVGLFEDV